MLILQHLALLFPISPLFVLMPHALFSLDMGIFEGGFEGVFPGVVGLFHPVWFSSLPPLGGEKRPDDFPCS